MKQTSCAVLAFNHKTRLGTFYISLTKAYKLIKTTYILLR